VGLLQVAELIRLYLRPLFYPQKRLPRFTQGSTTNTEIVTVREGLEVSQRPQQQPRSSSPFYSAIRVLLADAIVRGVILLGLLVLIHFVCWHIHFKLLVYNGEGNPFMEPQFISSFLHPPPDNLTHHCFREREKQLETFPPGAYPQLSTFGAMLNIHRTIHVVNFGLRASHPTASKWYTWPTMHCRVVPFYYGVHEGKPVKILSIGNLFTWYLMLGCIVIGGLLVILFLSLEVIGFVNQHILRRISDRVNFHRSGVGGGGFFSFLHRLQDSRLYDLLFVEVKKGFGESGLAIGLSLGGYALNLIPFMLVPRITWIYHYQPAILHGTLFVGTIAQITLRLSSAHPRAHKFVQRAWALAIFGATVTFYHFLPWTYGFPLTNLEHEKLKLISYWY
jgi:dolichyl-phosphate-mannose--protein O-mannosyl transferase